MKIHKNLTNQRSVCRREARAHLDDHAALLCQLHAAVVQHLRAAARKGKHRVIGDRLKLGRRRILARVGAVDAVHVRVDQAAIRAQKGGQCDRVVSEPPRPSVVTSPRALIP